MKRLIQFFESHHWSNDFDFSDDDAAFDDLTTSFDRKHPFAAQLAKMFKNKASSREIKDLVKAGYAEKNGGTVINAAWDEFVPPAPPLLSDRDRRKLDKELKTRGDWPF